MVEDCCTENEDDVMRRGRTSLLYGILNWGEAYLIPTRLMQEQTLAQVEPLQSIKEMCGRDCCSEKEDNAMRLRLTSTILTAKVGTEARATVCKANAG